VDLFGELLPSLLQTKNYLIDDDNEKEYTPYVVNRSLSNHVDCLLYANEMNNYPHLDKKMQYDYYYHSLPAKKRPYQKWLKYTEASDITLVKEFYGFSLDKAKEAIRILTKEQILEIKELSNKGGTSK
jgi:hypothetical protein